MAVRSNVSQSDMSAVTEKNSPFIPWDNPDNIISAATARTMQNVVVCGGCEVAMVLGIPANIINLVVLTHQGLKDRVTLMLFCLAIFDLLNLLCYFSISINCFFQPIDPVLAWNVETVQYPQVLYLNLMAAILSVTMVTILSVDRCLAIALPLKAARILTYRRTVVTIFVVSAMIIAVNMPSLWLTTITWVTDPASNRSKAQVVPTQFALQNPIYGNFFRTYRIAIKSICLVAVVISCSITVRTLKAAGKLRAKMSETKLHQSEIQITVMLLFVCMVMVICLIPEQLVTAVFLAVPDFFMFRKYHNLFVVCHYFIFFAQNVNSSSNFFMYVLLSSKYRATLMELLPCRQK